MNSCSLNDFENVTITNPTIIGGQATNLSLVSPSITGGITIDSATANDLAETLCPLVVDCVEFDPASVAAVFNDCDGVARAPGTSIPSCSDMNTAIETAINAVAVTDARIAGVFTDCDGAPRAPGVALPSCGDLATALNALHLQITNEIQSTLGNISSRVPESTDLAVLPGAVYGGREILLGRPTAFLEYGEYLIPVYENPCTA